MIRLMRQLSVYAHAVLFTLAALLPIVNPLGSAPIFLSMTADLPVAARRRLAVVVARYSTMLLIAAMLVGSYVLEMFGVSLPIVRVGGGMLVTVNGWRLLNAAGPEVKGSGPVDAWEREAERRAFYPLTFPLTTGPGSVSIAITLGAKARRDGMEVAADIVGVLIVGCVVWFCFRYASRLIAYLGETGTEVVTRLSSFILLCIGVSIIWSGLVDLIRPLLAGVR
jgi:multiple antibiotic resistance protein